MESYNKTYAKKPLKKKSVDEFYYQESIYRKFFEESRDMICISSPDDKILDVNRAGVNMLGYSSRVEFIATANMQYIYHSVKNMNKWKELMHEHGFVKDFEATMVKKNGSLIAVLQTSCAITDKNGELTAHASIIRDVTESVKNTSHMHKQNVDLIDSLYNLKKSQPKMIQQEKLASIGQLAAGIAHELNNPIGFISSNFTTLKSYVTIIKKYIEQLEDITGGILKGGSTALIEKVDNINKFKERQKLNYIFNDIEDLVGESMEGVHRITRIVRNLRNFSRIDVDSEIEQYNINDALESTLIVARNEIKYVAEVQKEFSETPLVECIGGEINQVFLNIIVNAAQAIKTQNHPDKGTIKIRTFNDREHVYCEIIDDGPGIPGKIINRIFDPFFTTKEAGKGTGLGLNISYDIIVHKHMGDLLVESKEGEETKFTIKLPIKSRIEKEK